MRFFVLIVVVCTVIILNCSDKGTSNSNPEKETARVFFIDITNNMDVEELRGAPENKITCLQTLGPGIRVMVRDQKNQRLQLEFENVPNTGFLIKDGYATFKDENGTEYVSTGASVKDVEISWQPNLELCEFNFKASNPVQLISNNAGSVQLDSLRIVTLRED